jgi:hypothetical protein
MLVNADRKGPKDLRELADRMNAAKEHTHAADAWEDASKASAEGRQGPDLVEAYNRYQNAQTNLLAAHGGDAKAAQASLTEARARMGKGKSN